MTMATGENFKMISGNAGKEREKILNEAYNMKTNNPHILALRKEIEYYKNHAKNWEDTATEWKEMYEELEEQIKK
jgi:hypothetical protein